MKSVSIRSTKSDGRAQGSQQPPNATSPQQAHTLPLSPSADLHPLIERRAYELYSERGSQQGSALNDWLDAEREILSRVPSV